MKKSIAVLLSLALLTSGVQMSHGNAVSEAKTDEIKKEISSALEKNQENGLEKKSYIVSVSNDAGYDYLKEELSAEKAADVTEVSESRNILASELTAEASAQLSQVDGVVVEEDAEMIACGQETETGEDAAEWNMKMINAVPEQESAGTVRVAMLDSGVDVSKNIYVEERKNFVESEDIFTLYEDITGHGTAVAGIIASKPVEEDDISGVNPGVELYSGRVLDDDNKSPVSRVVEGIYWAIDKKADILCLCMGTENSSEILRDAIRAAENAGMLIIAAAGNGEQILYPAAYNEVMAVSSVNSKGELSESSASGTEIEIAAPGECVRSVASFGMDVISSGTSMAVPHVVGAASVIWEKNPSQPADFVRGLLDESANQTGDSQEFGNGIVDLGYALEHYDEYARNYTANQENTFENYSVLNTEDDIEYVEGMWGKEKHEEQATQEGCIYFSSEQMTLLKASAKYSDVELKGNLVFHGGDNYVATMEYLYQYAYLLSIYKPAPLSDWEKEALYDDASYLGNLVEGINNILNAYVTGEEAVDIKECAPLKVLGLAIHLSGDIYAHRTIVPGKLYTSDAFNDSQAIIDGLKSEFVDYSKFKGDIAKDNVEIKAIRYAKKYDTVTNKPINNKPIDNINFLPRRFDTASSGAVDAVIELYASRQGYSAKKWFDNVYSVGGFNHRMANLLKYTSKIVSTRNKTLNAYSGRSASWFSSYTVDNPVSNDYFKHEYH